MAGEILQLHMYDTSVAPHRIECAPSFGLRHPYIEHYLGSCDLETILHLHQLRSSFQQNEHRTLVVGYSCLYS